MGEMMDDLRQRMPWEGRTSHHYSEVEHWLKEHVGEFDREWYRFGTDIAQLANDGPWYDYYRFRDEQAAVLFQLRWGG